MKWPQASKMCLKVILGKLEPWMQFFNSLVPNALFLYPLETLENLTLF